MSREQRASQGKGEQISVARVTGKRLTSPCLRGAPQSVRPKLHLSSQALTKQAGAYAYSVDSRDWQALLVGIGGREADVMVEAKGKEQALAPMGVGIV
jgi:hypothetical protein